MRLLLIRHGQTSSNVAGAMDTAIPGADLTALGRAQAAAVPAALVHENVAAIYASTLVRTQQTARHLADELGLTVHVIDGFREISAGDNEMNTDADSVHAYIDTLIAWADGDLDRCMPGGQTGGEFLERYDAALREVAAAHAPDDTVAVVSHGAAIRTYCTHRGVNAGPDHINNRIANTGLAILEGSPEDGWELVHWHDEPLGGHNLLDEAAHDITGETPGEAVADAEE